MARVSETCEPVEPFEGQMALDGSTVVRNNTGKAEPVLTEDQWTALQEEYRADGPDREIEQEPVGTDDHAGDGDHFGGPTANPNPARIPDTLWWLWLRLHELEPSSQLGGILADKSGYHNTRDRNRSRWPGNYSIREAEDQGGPGDKAAALDWTFPDAQRGDYRTISKYTKRLVASGKDKNDPRLDGLREVYGQADSDSYVEGWDCRHLVDITSDASHLWHIHFSFDRSTVMSMAVVEALLSVLRGEPLQDWLVRTGKVTPPPAPKPAPMVVTHRPGSRELYWNRGGALLEGDDVRFVQRWIGPDRMGNADGEAGPMFDAGVRWYQRMRGITVDGRVGPQTWAQMGIRYTG